MIVETLRRPPRIAALFDTSAGYGSPQLELLAQSLGDFYGTTDCWLIEPDVKGKRGMHERAGLNIKRLATRMAPHGNLFHIDYNIQMQKWLADYKPDIVVVTSASVLPALLRLPQKPPLVIYYMLENMEYQRSSSGGDLIQLNRMARPWIDLICVPEMERAGFDLAWLGWEDIPSIEILNVSTNEFRQDYPAAECRFLHAGSICENTLSHYLNSPSLQGIAVDVYGILASQAMRDLFSTMAGQGRSVIYRGVLSMGELETVYNNYAYSFTMWKPKDVNQIHASPNKLFQSIARGVPPISAPHPQCVSILRRYGCGILMEDWSQASFEKAVYRARDLYGTTAYDTMVQNCRIATEVELNWPAQFRKVESFLIKARQTHLVNF